MYSRDAIVKNLESIPQQPEYPGRQISPKLVFPAPSTLSLPCTTREGLGHSHVLPSILSKPPKRGLWRRNVVEKPVPRQFGERQWRGSRGRRERRLVSRPSVAFPSLPAPSGPARRLEGHRDPDSRLLGEGSEGHGAGWGIFSR